MGHLHIHGLVQWSTMFFRS